MKMSLKNNGAVLVIMELLFLLFVITLLRNTFVKDSVAVTTVVAVWIILVAASYVAGEFESTARANFGLTLRTQAAFGMTYAGYSILHGLWPWCENVYIRFWLALWLYLTAFAPLIGVCLRYLTRQPVLLVTDLHMNKTRLLRWWGFECMEVIGLEDLSVWLQQHSDDRGHVGTYDTIIVDSAEPKTDYVVAGLSGDYFVDFIGVPSFKMTGYLLGPHPRPIASYSLSGVGRRLKRVVDLVLSGLAIIVLSPVFVVTSIAIKLDSRGPVFYRHRRLGRNMRELRILKFRTMHKDADKRLKDLLESDPALKKEFEEKFKLTNDPRVTRIGGFLRKFSIDELPQFFNIVAGEMSFVGPRPIVDDEVKYYKQHSLLMFRVPPGATGRWQVSGRNDTSYQSRVEMDTRYVQEWTFWEDLKIILKTLPAVLSRRGSY
ncbi:MAG: sugar transferase [candidate division WOR-3 bacterium]|nr:sugar transferase [candidate division WOR-3 bacterium]